MRTLSVLLFLWFGAAPVSLFAQAQIGPTPPQPAPPDDRTHYGEGVVREVDVRNGRVKLKHGPVETIGWKTRTADFVVADREQLAALRPGQAVRFELKPLGNKYVISRIHAAAPGR